MCCGEPSSCKSRFISVFISVVQDRQILNCSGSGDPELFRLILIQAIGIAGDRPPRYGKKEDLPRQELPNLGNLGNPAPASGNWHRGGQAPALR